MDRIYVEMCGHLSASFYNWNEAYQLAMELDDSTQELAIARQEEIYRVEQHFEAEVASRVMMLAQGGEGGPRYVAKQSFRQHNIFYRVLVDVRSGRHYVASLRAALLSRSRAFTVPLACVCVYRGLAVLAMAFVPLGKRPSKCMGEAASMELPELVDEVELISAAANVARPQRVVCEVFSGLDGRCYLTSTNLSTATLSGTAGQPLKREEMLAMNAAMTEDHEDVLRILRSASVLNALDAAVGNSTVAPHQRQTALVDALHFFGINIALLREVWACMHGYYNIANISSKTSKKKSRNPSNTCATTTTNEEAVERWERMREALCVEMLARTIKQGFYTEMQSTHIGAQSAEHVNGCFARHLKEALDERVLGDVVLAHAMQKFSLSDRREMDGEIVVELRHARKRCRAPIVERVATLMGARLSTDTQSGKRSVAWAPLIAARVAPRLLDPHMMISLDAMYRQVCTNPEHYAAFVLPLQIRVALWEGRYGDALNWASEAAVNASPAQRVRALQSYCGLLFTIPTVENVREGFVELTELLKLVEERWSNMGRAQAHMDAGCWLLASSDVVETTREASRHFRTAQDLLPSSLRSLWGAWMYIQPGLGELRCHQKDGATSTPTALQSLVGDALFFAKVAPPSDYVVEYLWELGMELANEQAARLLTCAVEMQRRVPHSLLDGNALLEDALRVYKEWDPKKYGVYIAALEADAATARSA